MKKSGPAAASILLALLPAPVWSKDPVVTGMALQQVQARDFEAPAAVVFPAVMTVLQDAGFRIQTADRDTGLITAIGSSESYMTWLPFIGFGTKKKVPIVSAFVEQRGPDLTRARLNFVISTGKSIQAFTDEKPVLDPQTYREAFERIEKEIFVRQAMAAPLPPTPPPVTLAATTAPATALATASDTAPKREWRQASFSPGLSVAFIDTSDIQKDGDVVRFWMMLYYRVEEGSDHVRSQREADCTKHSFRDLSRSYLLDSEIVKQVDQATDLSQAQPNTVNDELILTACGVIPPGKLFQNPGAAVRLFFEEAQK